MGEPRVAVAMMTRNRSGLLKQSILSVLRQTGVDLTLFVLDSASTDDTPRLVGSIDDPRVRYIRHSTDIGILRNWNRAVQMAGAHAPYTCIFHDDDLMMPGYLAEAVRQLDRNPTAGFSLVIPQFISFDGRPEGEQDCSTLRPGLMNGLDFLELVVNCRGIDIYPPSILFRSTALLAAGPVDSPHTRTTADMNLYYRIAASNDILFLPKVLVQFRQHDGSDTGQLHRSASSVAWYGAVAERLDAIGYLLRSSRAEKPQYRRWLADRLLRLHVQESAAAHPFSPEMYHTFENRVAILREHLEQVIPRDQPLLLVDNAELHGQFNSHPILPFLEARGEFNGAPVDSAHAIKELGRMIQVGAKWIVFAWPGLWWLDQYADFIGHLEAQHRCRLRSPHGIIYEITPPPKQQGPGRQGQGHCMQIEDRNPSVTIP